MKNVDSNPVMQLLSSIRELWKEENYLGVKLNPAALVVEGDGCNRERVTVIPEPVFSLWAVALKFHKHLRIVPQRCLSSDIMSLLTF